MRKQLVQQQLCAFSNVLGSFISSQATCGDEYAEEQQQLLDVILKKKKTLGCYQDTRWSSDSNFLEVEEAAAGFFLQLAVSSMAASSDVEDEYNNSMVYVFCMMAA
ncbi:hypothetical protein Dimus_011165, partial [Dionaea muscipula]